MESQHGGNSRKKKTGTPHRCFRTNGCEICNSDFHKKSHKFNYSYSDRQQSCPIVSLEDGEYRQSRAFKNHPAPANLAFSTVSWDHTYFRIFTKQIECPSRMGVLECKGFFRLEISSKYVSEHNQTFWISNIRPLCI